MIAGLLGLALATAQAAPLGPSSDLELMVDLGGPSGRRGPAALVVGSPGLAQEAWLPLVEALEARGLDTWALRLPDRAGQPSRLLPQLLSRALAALDGRPTVVVGEGLGGTFAALWLAEGAPPPNLAGLALLGAPLTLEPVALTRWMADLPPRPGSVDLERAASVLWNDRPALATLLGDPLPPLSRVAAPWLRALRGWMTDPPLADLRQSTVPILAVVGDVDNLAPVEVVHPWVPAGSLRRFGPERIGGQALDHADLMRDRRSLWAIARWSARQARLAR